MNESLLREKEKRKKAYIRQIRRTKIEEQATGDFIERHWGKVIIGFAIFQ